MYLLLWSGYGSMRPTGSGTRHSVISIRGCSMCSLKHPEIRSGECGQTFERSTMFSVVRNTPRLICRGVRPRQTK